MIAYVESNFCLELAFQQEEEVQAEEILQLAEGGRFELVFPQFAVCEIHAIGKRASGINCYAHISPFSYCDFTALL